MSSHHEHDSIDCPCKFGVRRSLLTSSLLLSFDPAEASSHAGILPQQAKAVDEYGHTPLHQACTALLSCDDAVVRARALVAALIAGGADVNAASCGYTPLHRAAVRGDTQIVTSLLAAGAFVNVPDCASDGGTALHKAVKHGHTGVVEMLCSCGCDLTLLDGRGKTALDVANETGKADIVAVLQRHWPSLKRCEPTAAAWIAQVNSQAPDEYGRALCTGQTRAVTGAQEAGQPPPPDTAKTRSVAPAASHTPTATGVLCAICHAKVFGVIAVPTGDGDVSLVCLKCARTRTHAAQP